MHSLITLLFPKHSHSQFFWQSSNDQRTAVATGTSYLEKSLLCIVYLLIEIVLTINFKKIFDMKFCTKQNI